MSASERTKPSLTRRAVLLGERIFARAAYGVPPLGRDRELIRHALDGACAAAGMTPGELDGIEQTAGGWAQEMAERICAAGYRVVGCSTTFEQTAASVALLHAVKKIAPATVTLLGGANCDGPMAEGVLTLNVAADFVFRGECEHVFVQFLQGLRGGRVPRTRIVSGEPCADLDALPAPDFTQFFRQVDVFSAGSGGQYGDWLIYESSRGCWWGEKRHCTFCGLNAEGMATRRKLAERVIADLRLLRARHGPLPVCLTDNIMPHEYFRTLLPRLQEDVPGIALFYEIKANLSLAQVRSCVDAGVRIVQPGIEGLSTWLLQTMRKGVTARQNLALLRYARACGLELRWNLLYGLPGDSAEDYEEQLALTPCLRHLEPPQGLFRVTIDRFSPYHFAPEQFGIEALRPATSYLDILPETGRPMDVAYHFDGEFASGSRDSPELIARLRDDVAVWQSRWHGDTRPVLAVMPIAGDHYLVVDTRGVEGCEHHPAARPCRGGGHPGLSADAEDRGRPPLGAAAEARRRAGQLAHRPGHRRARRPRSARARRAERSYSPIRTAMMPARGRAGVVFTRPPIDSRRKRACSSDSVNPSLCNSVTGSLTNSLRYASSFFCSLVYRARSTMHLLPPGLRASAWHARQ